MKTLLLSIIVIAALLEGCRDNPARQAFERGGRAAGEKAKAGRANQRHALVYPYSVVNGGVESVADVREAMARDPEVAAHYADLEVGALRVERLPTDVDAYVSFRKHGKVFWTSRKVRLAAGERILTDGKQCVRGRCGNRISWTMTGPLLPVEFREPTSGELVTPAVRGQSIDELPLPPLLGELVPAAVPAAVLIADTHGLPGYVGGGAAGGSLVGGGGSGGSTPGANVNPGPGFITGGPAVIVPPDVYPIIPSFPAIPPAMPGILPPPGTVVPLIPGQPYTPVTPLFPPFSPPVTPTSTVPPGGTPPTVPPWPSPQPPSPSGTPSMPPDTPTQPPPSGPPAGPPGSPAPPGQPPLSPMEAPPTVPPSEVPEPRTVAWVALGCAALFAWRGPGRSG